MKWLYKLEWKYGKYAIPNLMLIIVIGMFSVFGADLLFPQAQLSSYLYFNRDLIFQGQVWRILSFMILPPSSSLLFFVFVLYFYYMIGTTLERAWGSFKFNVYYFCGVLGTIVAGLISGYAENSYLNLSLFLAFAALFPQTEVRLFFLIPIKIKYLAYVDAAFLLITLIIGSWSTKASVLASLVNLFIFFGNDFTQFIKLKTSTWSARRKFKNSMRR